MRTASALVGALILGIGTGAGPDHNEPPAKPDPKAPWSEAVEGLQCWLQADKAVWKVDEVPAFRLHVRNQGKRDLDIHTAQDACKLELDGAWFDWTGPVSILSGTWPAGRQYDDFEVHVTLEARWASGNKPIELKPGKHKVQVAYATLDRKQPVRVASNAVEIQIEVPPLPREQPKIDVIGAGETAMELVKTTKDSDAKWMAIRILGNLQYERAIPLLLESLSDSHHYVRSNAARALGDMKVATAARPLTDLLQKEQDGGVIQQMSLALGNLGYADALPVLKGAAKHEDVQTRMWVLQAIGRLGGKGDVPFLAGYLDDPSQSVQASAAQAIEQITGADFGFPKRSGPSSPDEGLRRAKAWWAQHKGEYDRR
jgi:hypothetical protein